MEKGILFVDDEDNIINALKRTFMLSGYRIFFAANGKCGLEILDREKIDLVISDFKMPEMDGTLFLKKVKEKYPHIIRIILSGFIDQKEIVQATCDGIAKSYLTKPWDNDKLKKQISHLFTIYDAINCEEVLKIVRNIEQLPVLPSLYYKVLKLINEDKEIHEISGMIQKEPSYVSKILKIVNSAFYGGEIGSIKQALVFLGRNTIKDIIIYSELFDYLKFEEINGFTPEMLWEHFHLCNKITHLLYEKKYLKRIPEQYHSIGLLHDIGKILIAKYSHTYFRNIIEKWMTASHLSIVDTENSIIGTAHTNLGAYLFDWWNLPEYMIEVCLYHHNPLCEKNQYKELCCLVHIADIFSWKVLSCEQGRAVDESIYNFLNMSEDSVMTEIKKIKKPE